MYPINLSIKLSAMEMEGSADRNIGNIIICGLYALGQGVLGFVAWISPSWRTMLRILYSSGILSIAFFWTVPESIRWLVSVNRQDDVKEIISRMAALNKRDISQSLIDKLLVQEAAPDELTAKDEGFLDSMRSKVLLLRLIHCSFTWICCTFVYYGLTMHSVAISDNIYSSFIFAVVIEIPGYVLYYYSNEKFGRRLMLCLSQTIGGLACLIVGPIPECKSRYLLCDSQ